MISTRIRKRIILFLLPTHALASSTTSIKLLELLGNDKNKQLLLQFPPFLHSTKTLNPATSKLLGSRPLSLFNSLSLRHHLLQSHMDATASGKDLRGSRLTLLSNYYCLSSCSMSASWPNSCNSSLIVTEYAESLLFLFFP